MLRTITYTFAVALASTLALGGVQSTAGAQSTGSLGSAGSLTTTPPPVAEPPRPLTSVFIGDSFTSPAAVGTPVDNWAEYVAGRFCWTPTYLARGGAGYITIPDRQKYSGWADEATAAGPDVIVVQGSTNDVGSLDVLPAAVEETLGELARLNPDATVVAVSAIRPTYYRPELVEGLRSAVEHGAQANEAMFVDATDPDWLGEPEHYTDGLHLSDAGHTEFGRLVGDEMTTLGVPSAC